MVIINNSNSNYVASGSLDTCTVRRAHNVSTAATGAAARYSDSSIAGAGAGQEAGSSSTERDGTSSGRSRSRAGERAAQPEVRRLHLAFTRVPMRGAYGDLKETRLMRILDRGR